MGELRFLDRTGEVQITGRAWSPLRAGKPTDHAFTAVSGTTTTCVLPSGASTRTDDYKDLWFAITAGQGAGQAAVQVTASVAIGGGQVQITFPALGTAPNATSVCRLFLAEKRCIQALEDLDAFLMSHELVLNGDGSVNDGYTFFRHGADVSSTLSCPFSFSGVRRAGAGTFAATGQKGYRIVGKKGSNRTTGSLEVIVTLIATTDEVDLTWAALPGSPDNIEVYYTTTPGTYGASSLLATLSGSATSYTHTGGAAGAGSLPTANTTGGPSPAYGVPPASGSMVTTPLSVPALKKGQQYWFWVNLVVPGGTPAAGNPRQMRRHLAA